MSRIQALLSQVCSYCFQLTTSICQVTELLFSWASQVQAHATTENLLHTHYRGRRIMLLLLLCCSTYRGISCSYRGWWLQPWWLSGSSYHTAAAAAGRGGSGWWSSRSTSSQLLDAWAKHTSAAVAAVAGLGRGKNGSSSSRMYLWWMPWLQQRQKSGLGWVKPWGGKGLVPVKAAAARRHCPQSLGENISIGIIPSLEIVLLRTGSTLAKWCNVHVAVKTRSWKEQSRAEQTP